MKALKTQNNNYLLLLKPEEWGFKDGIYYYYEGLCVYVNSSMNILCCVPAYEWEYLSSVTDEIEIEIPIENFKNCDLNQLSFSFDESEEHTVWGDAYECSITGKVYVIVNGQSYTGYPGAPGVCDIQPYVLKFNNVDEMKAYITEMSITN